MTLMPKLTTKQLVSLGFLAAAEIVLSRFLSISTPIVKIGFAFIPVALGAMLYGPVWAGLASASADFVGAVLFPVGPYFPGFTLTAFLTGMVYGLFLYEKPNGRARVVVSVLLVALALNLGLGSVWLHVLLGKSVLALLPARLLKCVVVTPVQIFVIHTLCGGMACRLRGAEAL